MINQHMGRFEHSCVSSCLMASYCHFFALRSGEITGMDACLYTDTVFCVVTRLATWSKAIPGVLDETMRGDSMTVAVSTGRTEGRPL